jgi:hypothetical protein
MDGRELGKNKMNQELLQLLLSLPRCIDQDRQDINELVALGLAEQMELSYNAFRRTQAGQDYIQTIPPDQRILKYK